MASSNIERVIGRRLWDSRGRPTIEVETHLTSGARGRAIAPAGASTGSAEVVDLRDGGKRFRGWDVGRAVQSVKKEISCRLNGLDAQDQTAVDAALIALDGTTDKSSIGGNAIVATSMSIAHAAAQDAGVPLWRYLAGGGPVHLPLPEIQIFGGGAHAGRRVDVQDFMIVAVGASSYSEALDWSAEVYSSAGELMAEAGLLAGVADEGGFWPLFRSNSEALDMLVQAIERAGFRPGEQVAISLDIAAAQFSKGGRYRLGLEQRELGSDAMTELLLDWIQKYPIVAIEDPLAEDDVAGLARFTARTKKVAVVGDDFLATNASRIQAAATAGACNATLIKPNQVGTLTEAKAAFDAALAANWCTIASGRSGETEDVTIVHLAVGWGSHMLKVGSFARSERMAKWNEGLRIAETLGGQGTLLPRSAFPWGK
jgi:enolase